MTSAMEMLASPTGSRSSTASDWSATSCWRCCRTSADCPSASIASSRSRPGELRVRTVTDEDSRRIVRTLVNRALLGGIGAAVARSCRRSCSSPTDAGPGGGRRDRAVRGLRIRRTVRRRPCSCCAWSPPSPGTARRERRRRPRPWPTSDRAAPASTTVPRASATTVTPATSCGSSVWGCGDRRSCPVHRGRDGHERRRARPTSAASATAVPPPSASSCSRSSRSPRSSSLSPSSCVLVLAAPLAPAGDGRRRRGGVGRRAVVGCVERRSTSRRARRGARPTTVAASRPASRRSATWAARPPRARWASRGCSRRGGGRPTSPSLVLAGDDGASPAPPALPELLLAVAAGGAVGAALLVAVRRPQPPPVAGGGRRRPRDGGLRHRGPRRSSGPWAAGPSCTGADSSTASRAFLKVYAQDSRDADLLYRGYRTLLLRDPGDDRRLAVTRRRRRARGVAAAAGRARPASPARGSRAWSPLARRLDGAGHGRRRRRAARLAGARGDATPSCSTRSGGRSPRSTPPDSPTGRCAPRTSSSTDGRPGAHRPRLRRGGGRAAAAGDRPGRAARVARRPRRPRGRRRLRGAGARPATTWPRRCPSSSRWRCRAPTRAAASKSLLRDLRDARRRPPAPSRYRSSSWSACARGRSSRSPR